MIRSMTGFGDAQVEAEGVSVRSEIRSVNNRYLKIVTRLSNPDVVVERELEKLVRERLSRGTVTLTVTVHQTRSQSGHRLDIDQLGQFYEQLQQSKLPWPSTSVSSSEVIGHLLSLPGVVQESHDSDRDSDHERTLVIESVTKALDSLMSFRTTEGEAIVADLLDQTRVLHEELDRVVDRAPNVVIEYRDRLLARVNELIEQPDFRVEEADLSRELAVYADRSDINEEITRLRTHLEQFEALANRDEALGRKLEFLVQEMYREVNTIGSKSNDVVIARSVIEMKAAIEKMREILQNVE